MPVWMLSRCECRRCYLCRRHLGERIAVIAAANGMAAQYRARAWPVSTRWRPEDHASRANFPRLAYIKPRRPGTHIGFMPGSPEYATA